MRQMRWELSKYVRPLVPAQLGLMPFLIKQKKITPSVGIEAKVARIKITLKLQNSERP